MPRKQSVGPSWSAFGRVVEHDVENHFDARAVQGLDHVAELVDRAERILPRAVRRVRGEERDGLVAPVVDQPRRAGVRIEREHRQQFDGRDAEILAGRGSSRSGRRRCRAFSRRRPEFGWRVKPRTCIS